MPKLDVTPSVDGVWALCITFNAVNNPYLLMVLQIQIVSAKLLHLITFSAPVPAEGISQTPPAEVQPEPRG